MAYGTTETSDADGDGDKDTASKRKPKLDLLPLVREEMRRAVGFEQDAELRDARERALAYFKGDVSKDIDALPNRSKAVSSDVSDAVEGLLPDLMEIFVGGDDVVTFKAQGEQDEDAAAQETAYIHHVAFQDNEGFLNFYTALKDALLLKLGIFHHEWKEDVNEQDEQMTGKNAVELQLMQAEGLELTNVVAENPGADLRQGEATYSVTVTKRKDLSGEKYWAVAPDDFAAAPDTVNIADATYCVERQRPRVQDLIADGFDEDKVRALPEYAFGSNQTIQQARDGAGESTRNGGVADDTSDELRQVEVRKHCIRVLNEETGKLDLWCVYTDAQAEVELLREEITRIPYACGSPYIIPHRLIGRSVADLLIDTMQIKTAGVRMLLDSGYFAINQRFEVDMSNASQFTISDLLRNEPNVPVRSKNGNAVRPLTAAGLSFDPYKMLEYFSTVGEMRTGIVRNAQGLNPDTLHDTAKGAMMLLSAAQKRVRMIARVLSETLVKPLFLGMHADIRENCKAETKAKLLGKWVAVNPSKWAERNAMSVEVGLGSAGKDAELAAANTVAMDMKNIVETQGGAQGPIVTLKNVYKLATDRAKKLGVKSPEKYYTDPDSPEGQAAQAAMANKPDPEMAKVQAAAAHDQAKLTQDAQHQSYKLQSEQQMAQVKVESEQAIQANKSQMQAAADQHKQELEHQRELQKQADAVALEQMQIASTERLELMRLQSAERIAIETSRIKAEGMIAAAVAKADAQAATDALQFEEQHETSAA